MPGGKFLPRGSWALLAAGATSLSACAKTAAPLPPAAPPVTLSVDPQIVTADRATSEKELTAEAERALREGRYADAARAFELLLAAQPASERVPVLLFGLAGAYESLGDRPRARERYRELARLAPESIYARTALVRAIGLHAYLEEWSELGAAGDALLLRTDIEPIERMLALGARGLAKVEGGDSERASHDVQRGLDLVEEQRVGEGGRLPQAAAQLRFALAEIRRIRAERIALMPPDDGFGARLEARCRGLLDAQVTYAEAMHAVDPHWAAMAGYRVGEMYRNLHREVMALPVPARVKTEKDRQVFYASMHLRYRILLEKALKMLNGTVDLAGRVGDTSAWINRADAVRKEIEATLATEKATLARFPFTEDEMQRALQVLVERHEKKTVRPGTAETPH